MKILLTILLSLALAVGFAVLTLQDPGYALLTRPPYSVRMPLALLVVLLVAAGVGLYLLGRLVGRIARTPRRKRVWRGREAGESQTRQGVADLIAGDWERAERRLVSKLRSNSSRLVNYLGAAVAAGKMGNLQKQDEYIAKAVREYPEHRVAIGLVAGRLYVQAEAWDAAREVLEGWGRGEGEQKEAVRLLIQVYRGLGDWERLRGTLGAAVRLGLVKGEELAGLVREVYGRYFAGMGDVKGVQGAFGGLAAEVRRDGVVVAVYVRRLLELAAESGGALEGAAMVLRGALERGWNAELAYLYGKCAGVAGVAEHAKWVEGWAKRYGGEGGEGGVEVELNLVRARLARRRGKLERARDLFSQVVAREGELHSAGARAEARLEFGGLLEEVGDGDGALICYRQGVGQGVGGGVG